MTTIEHKELRGITLKNIVVTIISTASIVISVMTTYFNLKGDISSIKNDQAIQVRVNDLRIKALETQLNVLQQQVTELQHNSR
jgi:hypothetical protein